MFKLHASLPMHNLMLRMTKAGIPTVLGEKSIPELIDKYAEKKGLQRDDVIAIVDEVVKKVEAGSLSVDLCRTKLSGMRAGLDPREAGLSFGEQQLPTPPKPTGLILR